MSQSANVPPRQQVTEKFPVVGETSPGCELTRDNWRLTIVGASPEPITLNYQQLLQLPQFNGTFDIHCVTRWSRLGDQFAGVLFADLVRALDLEPQGEFVQFVAYSNRDHDTSLPLTVCLNEQVLLMTEHNGQPLLPEHGYPVRTFAPTRYFYKSLKWLKEIRFLAEDQLGFWERGGYHNNADFLTEQRYVSGNLTEAELARLRSSKNFKRYRGQILLSLDLSGLDLTGADLSGVQLKNCCLDNCLLEGADLSGANLSNSSLINANLRGANLRGADLDGVLMPGADLCNACLDHTFLNATQFIAQGLPEAQVNGMTLQDAQMGGLMAAQIEFLQRQQVL